MTLNASEPSAVRLVAELASYIRETRAAVNAVTTGTGFSTTILALTGETSLTVGTELADVGHELIFATSVGASVLESILGGTNGQVKTFIFGTIGAGQISLTDGPLSLGRFHLEQTPLDNFVGDQHDILSIINVGGDGGVSDHGYWRELHRTDSVR